MIAEMTTAVREMILGGAAAEATARQVEEAMRIGREGLLPVIGVAIAAGQGLEKVQKDVDARVTLLDPSNPHVKDLEQFALAIHRVRERFDAVLHALPRGVYNCWIADRKAMAETGQEVGIYMVKGKKGVAPCQDN
jgi:hypothetical protein